MGFVRGLAAPLVVAAVLSGGPALAEPPDPALMARVAVHAEAIERMRTHASYAVEGVLERLDGDGKVNETKHMTVRMEADGQVVRVVIIKCTEDTSDCTDDARKDAKAGNERSKEERAKRYLEMPLRASVQSKYVFEQIAVDPQNPTHVEISFKPKEPNEHSTEGTVWIDTKSATLLSAGFKMSHPGFFVDYVHFTMELGATTDLGPAISHVTVDGRGGLLFFHKHFRGEANLSDYRIVP